MNNRVLVIECNNDLRENACETLQLCRYFVLAAENGVVGYDMVKKHRPACIVCDLLSPESRGEAFMQLIDSDKDIQLTPVVLASSNDSSWYKQYKGKQVMLRKPYTGNELVMKVQQAMRTR